MLSNEGTRVFALGGLEEVGLNCLVVETAQDLVLVDCGLAFSVDPAHAGGYVVPDLSYVLERRDKLRGVLLTHGHEDHVGAVPHLLAAVRVPVYGTRFTLAMLRERLARQGGGSADQLRAVVPGAELELGGLRAEFLRVAHSIPDACAVVLVTPDGTLLHSGDFNLAPEPVANRHTDQAGLQRWGDRGVDLLCCDSTNALQPGGSASEQQVAQGLSALLPEVQGRLYVAQFASNVGRMQQVVEASRGHGRRVTPLGRAVTRCARVARQYGYLQTAPGDWIAEARSRGLPRAGLTVLLGGSQAEPGSALWRVSRGLEPHHRLQPGDAVVFSARIIPGNEVRVQRAMNRCVAAGARVFMGERDGVHVSGHPAAADVTRLLQWVRPRQLLPVHGELRHRHGLLRLAERWGLEPQRLFPVRNGQVLVLRQGEVEAADAEVPAERLWVQAERQFPAQDALFAARRRMGRAGVALAWVPWGRAVGEAAGGVRVELLGICAEGERAALERAAAAEVHQVLAAAMRAGGDQAAGLQNGGGVGEVAERALRRFLRRRGWGRPVVRVAVIAPSA